MNDLLFDGDPTEKGALVLVPVAEANCTVRAAYALALREIDEAGVGLMAGLADGDGVHLMNTYESDAIEILDDQANTLGSGRTLSAAIVATSGAPISQAATLETRDLENPPRNENPNG